MLSLNTLSNKKSSLSTDAVKTRAHGLHAIALGLTERKSSSVPSKLFLGYPSLFSGSWSNPNPSFSTRVDDGKAPLSFQVQNIAIRNHLGTEWVYNFNNILSKNEIRPNPNTVNGSHQIETQAQLKKYLYGASANPETIYSKKSYHDKGRTRPSKITSGSEAFIHNLSIAGDRK